MFEKNRAVNDATMAQASELTRAPDWETESIILYLKQTLEPLQPPEGHFRRGGAFFVAIRGPKSESNLRLEFRNVTVIENAAEVGGMAF